jgi:GDP-fucose transporter C1
MKGDEAFALLKNQSKTSPEGEIIRLSSIVLSYIFLSIARVFLIRSILHTAPENSSSIFLSWYQFVTNYVIIILVTTLFAKVSWFARIPLLHYDWRIFLKLLPSSLLYVIMIVSNNKSLEHICVSGYFLSGFSVLVVHFVIANISGRSTISLFSGAIWLAGTCGFVLGVLGEPDFPNRGSLYGVSSSICVLLYTFTVNERLDLLNRNEFAALEYHLPVGIVLLFPVLLLIREWDFTEKGRSIKFWALETITGLINFLLMIIMSLLVRHTRPLIHNLTGALKSVLQNVLAYLVFPSETISAMKLAGLVLVTLCQPLYAHSVKQDMRLAIIALGQAEGQAAPALAPRLVDSGPLPDEVFQNTTVDLHEAEGAEPIG